MKPIRFTCKSLLALGGLACLVATSSTVLAGMTAAEAERLGKDLTPMGAEKAGNKAGTIPAWDGGIAKAPAGFNSKNGYLDPFANEKPILTITAANMAQYKDSLTPGQMEMLRRFPTYKMLVYPSHRTAALPSNMYDSIKAESTKATLADGGNGVLNVVHTSVPFPLPKTGIEVMWNHLMRHRGGSAERFSTEFSVLANGSFTPVTRREAFMMAHSMANPKPNRLMYFMGTLTGPSSVAGESVLGIDPLDQVKEKRQGWIYNPGQRRVLRAPDIAYDQPGMGSDGLATNDDYDGYNGSPDRYDWKLIGKKEMFISYNNYRLTSKSVKYADIIRPGHMNQDMVRYEPHRVWVVEATLKTGKRHMYAKRMFYIDEDSWQIAHTDAYDGRGELWRVHEIAAVQYYDAPTPWFACETHYDLQARRYLVTALSNQEKPIKFGVKFDVNYFSTDNLRDLSN